MDVDLRKDFMSFYSKVTTMISGDNVMSHLSPFS
jgi:hypothetical protein